MKLTNPYFLIGLVAIVVGIVLYYPLNMYTFPMYGLPMTTIVLIIIGLVLVFLGIKK